MTCSEMWSGPIGSALFLAGLLATLNPAAAQTAGDFVAGVQPDRRPQYAPRVMRVEHDDAWRERTRRGITKPYPPTLMFIESHGHWYTPFDRPGMPGRYDLRNLHRN